MYYSYIYIYIGMYYSYIRTCMYLIVPRAPSVVNIPCPPSISPHSYEEAGRYLETYKAFENKPPDMLMERIDSDFSSRVSDHHTN